MWDDQDFEQLARETNEAERPAAPSLKARLYTALIREQQASGPLEALTETRENGRGLCVFEHLVTIAPMNSLQPVFYCQVCHARVLAERLDRPPIWWPHCPYAHFH
ncbi:MAG: hypothetical protein IPJ98_14845 [Bryobacterales bacterium]|nr:hypothetical protein [Bryobacterales bacterium]